jgi:Fe-S-cluster containining protein
MTTSESITLETKPDSQHDNFPEAAEQNPCAGCSAPCCRVLLVPHPTPTTFMDLDYIRYVVGFHRAQMILNNDGRWQLLVEQACRLLDPETSQCTVHGTPRQPKTCVFFNPYRCWYKRNFDNRQRAPELIRVDMDKLEAILPHVRFDEDGNILEIPKWESIRDL